MKYFLVILLGAISFFAPAQVVLPDSVARFYLERHFFAKSLQSKNELLNLLAQNQEQIIYKQDSLIKNYEKSESVHSVLENNLRLQVQANVEANQSLRKRIRKQNFLLFGLIVIFASITL